MAGNIVFAVLLMAVSLEGSLGFIGYGGFRVFRGEGEEELLLLSDKEQLPNAAKTGEHHIVQLTESSQSGVTQEGVKLDLDCGPLLDLLPEGNIQWQLLQLDEFGNIINGGLVSHTECD